jgi:hypothetical protein
VEAVNPLSHGPLGGIELQLVSYVDAPDNQDIAFLFDFTGSLRYETSFTCRDVARLQRASKGSRQSTRCGCHHVIQCRGVRLVNLQVHAIVFRHV